MKKYFLKDKSLNNIDDDLFRYQDFANNAGLAYESQKQGGDEWLESD